MPASSTIQLLRFHFSFFLMPVFWFALYSVDDININKTILIFLILHLIIYPASNGYNSYMDRDKGSIGGIRNPMEPTTELYYTSILFDLTGLVLSLLISFEFFACIIIYIAASRAYSYRGIRLKKFSVAGLLTVIIFQGGFTFFMVVLGCSVNQLADPAGMIAASLLIAGFYPLTQVYQHKQDKEDGVITISYRLGIKGTFVFTAIVYSVFMMSLFIYMKIRNTTDHFLILQLFLLPVLIYFFRWMILVWKDTGKADFKNTMQMNLIGSFCSNAGFIYLLLTKHV